MTFTYTWANAEQTSLKREDADGNIAYVPVAEGNRDYAAFLASGETAADYVAPPEPEPYVSPLEARVAALEANEIIDDAVDTSLLSLLASASARLDSIEARLAALEGGN